MKPPQTYFSMMINKVNCNLYDRDYGRSIEIMSFDSIPLTEPRKMASAQSSTQNKQKVDNAYLN